MDVVGVHVVAEDVVGVHDVVEETLAVDEVGAHVEVDLGHVVVVSISVVVETDVVIDDVDSSHQ